MKRASGTLKESPIISLQSEYGNAEGFSEETVIPSWKKVEEAIYSLEAEGGRIAEKAIYFLEKSPNIKEVCCPIEFIGEMPVKTSCDDDFGKRQMTTVEEQNQPKSEIAVIVNNAQEIIHPKADMNLDICNYQVRGRKKNIFINRDGKELKEMEEIISEIKIQNGCLEYISILTKDIKRLTVIIGDRFSSAWINPDVKHVTKIIENLFRDSTQGIPIVKTYIDYGWQKINGKRIYVHDSVINYSENMVFRTGMNLPFYSWNKQQAAYIFIQAYNLYEDKGPMSVMLAFSVLGVLYQIFDEAGYAPQFLLFINGKTGSMKTTLSKILFIQLTDDMHRETPRRIDADTVTSFGSVK